MPIDQNARYAILPEIDLSLHALVDSALVISGNWESRNWIDEAGTLALSYSNNFIGRTLFNSSGQVVYRWETGTFSKAQIFSSTITNSTLIASSAVVSDGSKVLVSSTTTATEIGYVAGVTSAIQTQLDSKPSIGLILALAYGQTLQ